MTGHGSASVRSLPATWRAAFWMLGAILSFSSMAVAGRELAGQLDTFEIMMYRSLFGALIVIGFAVALGKLREINTQDLTTHGLRNLAHFTGQNLWFYAVTVIPLAQVFALEFTTPLWVILLSPLLLSESMTRLRVLAAVLGFCGILIVARPSVDAISPGMMAAASSAIFFALTFIFTKRLTQRQSITCILFYLTVMQLGLGLVTAGFDGDIALPDARALPFVVVIGAAGLLAHFCIANALSIAPATIVVPLDFARLPAIAVIGMLLYQEPLDLLVFVGALVIFAGNYLNIWAENRRHHSVT